MSTGIQRSRSCTSRSYCYKACSINIITFKTHLFRRKLILISILLTACARRINITSHSTAMDYRKSTLKIVHKPSLWQQNALNYNLFVKKYLIWMQTHPDFNPCDGLWTYNQHRISYYSQWSTGTQRSRLCTSHCYCYKTCQIVNCLLKKSLFGCKLIQISIRVTACACTINITCHSTVDGVPKNSVQNCEQTVAMATKHAQLTFQCSKHTCPDVNYS